jgi:hypothetical protein
MNIERTLLALCEEWRTLSEAEGDAIQASDWARVQKCQKDKHELQEQIRRASSQILEQGRPSLDQFRAIAKKLLALEVKNRQSLALQQEKARRYQRELQQAERNLRQVHRAYAPGNRSLWHSYS